MNREEIVELFKNTYKQTIEDNKDDYLRFCTMLSKLCVILKVKGILEELDINVIFDIEGGSNEK